MSAVIWSEKALDTLSDYYVGLTPALRNRLVGVVEHVNLRLSGSAQFDGEMRSGTDRIAFYPPLCVLYDVRPHKPVYVVRIKLLRFWDS